MTPNARHERKLLIRESHLDTFGHVNNATYLQIFEEARWDWITSNGFGLREIREQQVGPTILEITIKFLRELRNREEVTIRTEVLSYRGKICDLRQAIHKADGELACEAVLRCALFDLRQRKIVAPTAAWARALGVEDELAREAGGA